MTDLEHLDLNEPGYLKSLIWSAYYGGKENDIVNHPDKGKPSKIDRKEFKSQKSEYWKEVYDNWED